MQKYIHIPVIITLVTLCYVQGHAWNNSGQAFSLWPDTGQTTCYDTAGNVLDPCPVAGQPLYGQDAQYAGLARSYTKLDISGNSLPESATSWAMVRDNVTGLVWEAKQAKDSVQDYTNPHDADNTYSWCDTNSGSNGGFQGTCSDNDTEDFIVSLNSGLGYAGHMDWRLPTIHELLTLVDRGRFGPAISTTYFPQTMSHFYWSSTTRANNQYVAWLVMFFDGYGPNDAKSESYHVRAVRGGQVQPEDRFMDNMDGTVTDTMTCLQWQQATADPNGDGTPDSMNWENALDYAENLSLADHDDWRLPDINELDSIVDYSRWDPSIDPTVFPDTVSSDYWSSTSYAYFYTDVAWLVYYLSGGVGGVQFNGKSSMYYIRAVRSGQCGSLGYSSISATVGAGGSLDSGTPSPQTVANGSVARFTFNADTGYHVAGITGCGISYNNTSNAVSNYTATTGIITGECTVSATFAINQYTLLSSTGANGMINPLGVVVVNHGSNQRFTVTPNTNYQVADVLVDGDSVGAVTSYQFTNVTANHSISASFTINTYTVNSSVSGGNGTIAQVGDQIVNHGDTPSFTLTPDTDYHVYQVAGTCGGTLDGATFTVNPVTANCSVIASFSLTTYTVTSSVLGGNGIIAPEGVQIVNINDTLSFTLTPDAGYHIDQVISTCGGALSGNIFTTSPVTASCTVKGTFAINSYTLRVNFAGQGSGSVTSTPAGIDSCTSACIADFEYGQEVVLKASADESSRFTGWSGDGCSGIGDCTVVMDQAREITAIFVPSKFPWLMFMPAIRNQSQQ